MSLMSGLYVGTSGLQTSQNALNTTAHNLSNIETKGYTRQQVYLNDKPYLNTGMASISKQQTGLGVEYGQVRQVRDDFLDQAYRREAGRSAFYDVNFDAISEIETLLGEFDGVAFQDSLGGLWTAVQELQKDPASAVTQGALINTAAQFVERAQAVYVGLSDYQDNLNSRIEGYVDRINELGHIINNLNDEICKEELGVSQANDLRDQRNAALDELAGLANISYETNVDGGVEVMLEGTLFVARDMMFEMGTTISKGTGFLTPVWPQNEDAPVYSVTQTISTDLNTDIGQLKSILLARGDRRANFTDMEQEMYNNGKVNPDPAGRIESRIQATSGSVVMNVQAQLDQLVHDIVTKLNDILTGEAKVVKTPNGNVIKTLTQLEAESKEPGGEPFKIPSYDSEDKLPKELFVRLGTARYKENDDGTYSYVTEDTRGLADIDSMYTIANLKINPDLLKTPSELANGFVTDDKEVDNVKADLIIDAFSNSFAAINPNLTQKYNYQDYYAAMVGQVATTGSVYQSIMTAQQIATTDLDNGRQAVMGVSSNEELTNMIKYQNAYNAASRYINACNEMLENMLSNLAP